MLTQFGVRVQSGRSRRPERAIRSKTSSSNARRRPIRRRKIWSAPSLMREAERNIMLHVIDDQWKDHLLSMDHLKEGIGLRGYGQKDPLVEYKKESYTLFTGHDGPDRRRDGPLSLLPALRDRTAPLPFANEDSEYEEDERGRGAEQKHRRQSKAAEEQQRLAAQSAVQDMTRGIQKQHERELKELQFAATNGAARESTGLERRPKVGRNDPCPCGSGKKYKKCHGAVAERGFANVMSYYTCCCSSRAASAVAQRRYSCPIPSATGRKATPPPPPCPIRRSGGNTGSRIPRPPRTRRRRPESYSISAYRFTDATGALAAFDQVRPSRRQTQST